ncbi:MAG: HutD family protein [Acidovorax sp.]|uniref:HutD/Ves family protein n=1 Tax=Acidovorax sp. TaxID=1872122 RepID=UPI0039E41D15
MTVQFLDLAAIPATRWKNGGGSTRELACWPPGAGMDGFGWRVSVATIAAPGPFSAFAGVDRQIMLLDGDGVYLRGSGWQHALGERWQPFAFSGDEPVDCAMLGGTSTDFNLMLRRGAWRGQVQVLRQAPPAASAGLCMVLQGRWQGSRLLEPGQGFWWMQGQGERIAPVNNESVLAWIALEKI